MLEVHRGWSSDRISDVLNTLLHDGICWIDEQADPHEYWISSFFGMEGS